MIQIKIFVFNPFMENTFVVFDETNEALIIDPGCYEASEKKELTDYIKSNDLKVVMLINTHSHIDHCLGNAFVSQTYDVPLALHKSEEIVLKSVESYATAYGFQNYESSDAGTFLKEGDVITFGKSSLEVLFVPGHSPGHIALLNREQHICISGDVLFENSIGRTDLPGGDMDTLLESIRTKLFSLDDEIVVYAGHGPVTTIGKEKISNPFCGKHATIS